MLLVDFAREVLKHQVQGFRRCAIEFFNVGFSDRLNAVLVTPTIKHSLSVLSVPRVHLNLVQFYGTFLNVLGSWRLEGSLVRHTEEGFSIDEKKEVVILHIVVKSQLPLQLVILQFKGKQAWLR